MTHSKSNDVADNDNKDSTVRCAKCEYLNPHGSNVCGRCRAHLYVNCHHCGHRNQRAFALCAHCGQHLHRSLWRRWRKKLLPDDRLVKPWQVGLLILAVLLAYKIIVKVAEMQAPNTF